MTEACLITAKNDEAAKGWGGWTKEALSKPDAYLIFLSPHDKAGTARFVTIDEKVKGPWNRAVNLYLGTLFRTIANDAPNGSASGPKNGSASGPKNLGTS